MDQIPRDKLAEFWNWFVSVANDFGEKFENERLLRELDQKVGELGDFGWEVGPGVSNPKNNALVLTPCGHKDLLVVTKFVVENAPNCPGWEFFYSKPPKKWKRRFIMHDEEGSEIEIDASNWRYVMLKYPDGMFDMIIKAPELWQYSENSRQTAAAILIDGEIGEEKRLNWIETIEVVKEFEDNLRQKNNSINVLARHFNSLIEKP